MPTEGRRAAVGLLGGLTLAGLLALGALWAGIMWRQEPAIPPPNVPLAAEKSLGINTDLSHLGAKDREDALVVMEAAGLRWLRQRFPWELIEPEPGAYDWTLWDQIVEIVTRHNLSIVAVLDGAPLWARLAEDMDNPLAPPADVRYYGAFVAAFAERYGDWIDCYQIWDEPNIAPHWGEREINASDYAQLLREGAIQIRSADPDAVILLGALAPNVEQGGANMSDLLFLDALYQQNADEWFDVVAAQLYTFSEPLNAPPSSGRLNWARPQLLRDVMLSWGDIETAIWAVAFGVEDLTAGAVSQAVETTRRNWPWMGPMLWTTWAPVEAHGQYALVNANHEPGRRYQELQALGDALTPAWPGVYPADHPSGEWDGRWRVTAAGADIGQSGDRLRIRFKGTGLSLTVRRGAYRAFLFVTVDGAAANALPKDREGQSYVVLYDPLREVETVALARELGYGEHVAEVVAAGGWGQWAIVGWAVTGESFGRTLWPLFGLGLASLAVLAATLLHTWSRTHWIPEAWTRLVVRYRSLDARVPLLLTAGVAVLVYGVVGTLPSSLALVVLAGLLVLRPETGLPLIALALPFYQLGKPFLGKVFSMVEIITLLTLIGWAAEELRSRWLANRGCLTSRPREEERCSLSARFPSALDGGVLALAIVGLASILWAEHVRVAAREFRTVILEGVIFYGLLRAMVRRRRELWHVVDAWVLGGVLIALVGVYQWAWGQNVIVAEGVSRVRGFYGSPNNLALYLGRIFPLTVVVGAFSEGRLLKVKSGMGWRRLGYGIAALAMSMAIILTYSRGAWLLGVPASLLFVVIAVRRRRLLLVALAAIVVVAVVGSFAVGTGRLASLTDPQQGTMFLRLQLWRSSWAMIRDHPVLGIGLDNFLYHYRTYYVLPTAWEEFNLSHPHNLVLDFWLRLGLSGLGVLCWLLVAFFQQGRKAYLLALKPARESDALLALGLMAGMVGFVAHGLVDNSFFLVDLGFAFMLMLALIQVDTRRGQAGS